jgi:general secretion pathway protein D
MDVSNASDVEVIPLKNAIATDLAPLVARLIDGGSAAAPAAAPGQSDTSFKTTLLAEPRSNALILRAANPARVAQVRALVHKLDQPPVPGQQRRQRQHPRGLPEERRRHQARRPRCAPPWQPARARPRPAPAAARRPPARPPRAGWPPWAAAGSATSGLGAGAGSPSTASSNQPSTGGQIQADPSTNSLIITAPEPQYRQLRNVIDKLDGRRAQVLVESLIVEVNTNKLAEFGIQWQGVLGKQGDGTVGVIGTNSGAAGANILGLTTALASGTPPPSERAWPP